MNSTEQISGSTNYSVNHNNTNAQGINSQTNINDTQITNVNNLGPAQIKENGVVVQFTLKNHRDFERSACLPRNIVAPYGKSTLFKIKNIQSDDGTVGNNSNVSIVASKLNKGDAKLMLACKELEKKMSPDECRSILNKHIILYSQLSVRRCGKTTLVKEF